MNKKILWWFVSLLVFGATTGQIMAEGNWWPSKYGKKDRLGAANLLNPDLVLEAAKLVQTGKTYSLGIVTDSQTPAFPPRSFNMTILQPSAVGGLTQVGGQTTGPTKLVYNDDILTTWLGIGTQIDGLGHIGINHRYYNGLKSKKFADTKGLTQLGTEQIPPIVTRGVVLDIAGYLEVEMMEEGTAINIAEIEGAAERQGVTLQEGDVVLFHTGWLNIIHSDPTRFASVEPGLGMEGAQYLIDKNVVAIGADNWALEVIPFEEGTGVFGVHQELLTKNGIYILENIQTAELVTDEAWEFLFVLGQAKFAGAVQMVINPVAIR